MFEECMGNTTEVRWWDPHDGVFLEPFPGFPLFQSCGVANMKRQFGRTTYSSYVPGLV